MDNTSTDNKKSLINSITYTINKKMHEYNKKLDVIYDKINNNEKILLKLIEVLKKNNMLLEKDNKNIEAKNGEPKNLETKHIENKNVDSKIIEPIIINSNNISNYKEIKKECIDIDEEYIKDCLSSASLEGDILLFKKIYIDNIPKEYYPIRNIKKKYQYWLNNHMNDDDKNGTYIKETIIKNIEQCYLKVNTIDNYENIDIFIKNQDHIKKLDEQKYQDNFLLKISSIIKI